MMKMNPLKKWYVGTVNMVLSAALLAGVCTPRDAQAGLKDALGEMFLTSGTEAQSINTQRLRGFYGGSLSLRSPGRSFEIVQFAAPKIDAGCGGVDIFFGSFSFINGAQFEQLIRAIAANAVGYAIKLAIQAMCSPCGAILETLEEAIRDLNALAKNTCAISMASLTQTADKMMEHGRKIGEALSVSANRSADATAATNKSQSERPTQTATGGDANTAKSNPVLGNMVWRAAQQTMDSGNNTLRAFMSSREVTEMVQSIFGTVVVRSKEASDGECTAGASSERCDNKPLVIGSAVSHWDKLLRARSASPQGVGMWRCSNYNEGCTRVVSYKMTLAEWGGVEDIVNLALFGTTEAYNSAAYTSDSLIGSFIHKQAINENGSNLSVRARQMIAVIPMPILLMLMELQKTPGAAQTLGLVLSQQLPKYFEYIIAMELLNIAANTFTNQTEVDTPEDFKKQIEIMTAQLTAMRPQSRDVMDMIDGAYKVIQQSQTLTVSPLRSSNNQR
jgi:conjugative transfer pilus assembly protein TraH